MNEPKISVISPVHNSEEYLKRCVDSILSQTLSDIEVIFIDDASEDGSYNMLKSYADSDPRVLIIKLDKNIGSGGARNLGIEAARGKYLSFVDSDDTIAPDFLELLYAKAEETSADIIKGSCFEVFSNDLDSEFSLQNMQRQNSFIKKAMKSGKDTCLFFYHWHFTAIYRHAFIDKHSIRYGNTIVGEDSIFLLKAAVLSESFVFVPSARYNYYHRAESQSRIISQERYESSIESLKEQFDFLGNAAIKPESILRVANRKLRFGLRIHSYLLFYKYPGVDAEAYAQKLYEMASSFKYADKLGAKDYAISVFLSSNGSENLSMLGMSNSFDDELYVQLANFERLAKHIVDAAAQQDRAIDYLATVIIHMRKMLVFRAHGELRKFDQRLINEISNALSCLNTPELLPRLSFDVRAIVEYKADLPSLIRFSSMIDYFTDTVSFLSKTLDLLSEHPDAASEYYDFAIKIYKKLLHVSGSSQIKSDKQFGAVMARLTLAADSLKLLLEQKETNGDLL